MEPVCAICGYEYGYGYYGYYDCVVDQMMVVCLLLTQAVIGYAMHKIPHSCKRQMCFQQHCIYLLTESTTFHT